MVESILSMRFQASKRHSNLAKAYQKRLLRTKDEFIAVLAPKLFDEHADRQPGHVVWITGLSGSGKSTLARNFTELLRDSGEQVVLLDGDELRNIFSVETHEQRQFNRQTRFQLAMQYANLCRLIASQGPTVVIATISLFKEVHEWSRTNLPKYFEVYLDVPLKVLKTRDPKSIYRQFEEKQLTGVVGMDIEFDVPLNPHLVISHSADLSAKQAAQKLFDEFRSQTKP
jgi:adenylylsulfate kinase-like enzyme